MAEKKDSMASLKEIISDLKRAPNLPFRLQDARIWEVWDEVVGLPISNHARPSGIHRGTLRVGVSDPIWLQELRFMEGELRDKLNRELGSKVIRRIDFRRD